MTTYITDGTTIVTADAVDGFSSSRVSGIRIHPILGAPSPDITYQTAQLRTGTLRLVFTDPTDAETAETLNTSGSILTVASTDQAAVNFSYVPAEGDTVRRELDLTRSFWILQVEFQEVAV